MNKVSVVNIRGTNGSGKSYIVHHILKYGNWNKWIDNNTNKIIGYYNKDIKWVILGSYETACGGCDAIKTQNDVKDYILLWINSEYNVLFEGILISTITSTWADFSREISNKANLLFYFLNTPVEKCVSQVISRRQIKGNFKEYNPQGTINKWNAIDKCYKKLTEQGCYTLKGSRKEISKNLLEWFKLGGPEVDEDNN